MTIGGRSAARGPSQQKEWGLLQVCTQLSPLDLLYGSVQVSVQGAVTKSRCRLGPRKLDRHSFPPPNPPTTQTWVSWGHVPRTPALFCEANTCSAGGC